MYLVKIFKFYLVTQSLQKLFSLKNLRIIVKVRRQQAQAAVENRLTSP